MTDHETHRQPYLSKLSISQIVGTSAKTPNQVALVGNTLAYTASGGVVVCQLDLESLSITSQRFFCANVSGGNSSTDSPSSANAYLNMAFPAEQQGAGSPSHESFQTRKDSFGFPVTHACAILAGSNRPSHESTADCNANAASPGGGSGKLKDRVRSINCISLSPHGKILAVGEIGYQPRILLFSLAPDSSCNPVATIYEHTFGITSIAFSSDSRYFASLGMVNDGFINVWKYSSTSVHLHATNKCSSVINQMIWHENFIITLGLRLIKVWNFHHDDKDASNVASDGYTPTSPTKTMALKGRNALLGSAINSNFIGGSVLSSDELLVVTDNDQLLLLKLGFDQVKAVALESPIENFNSVLVDYENEKVWLSSAGTSIHSIGINQISQISGNGKSAPSSPTKLSMLFANSGPSDLSGKFEILTIADFTPDHLIYLTSSEEILLYNKSTGNTEKQLVPSLLRNISGVKSTYSSDLLAFSTDGVIKKISYSVNDDQTSLNCILKFELPTSELLENGLTAVDSPDTSANIILGDKFGHLYVLKLEDNKKYGVLFQTKAHSSTINDICYFTIGEYEFICSISRDRMIQIFYRSIAKVSSIWNILQTLPTHTGNLLKVLFKNGKIYVCSTDRTVSVHSIEVDESSSIKVYQEHILTFKNSPINMKIHADDLIVSTSDRALLVHKISQNYELQRSLKLYNEHNESLLVENFEVRSHLLITSCSDKSLRLFNYVTGKPLSVVWGHSDSILSLSMVDSSAKSCYTIGSDGCLFKWDLLHSRSRSSDSVELDSSKQENIESAKASNNEVMSLYTKVTRKIVPTVSAPQGTPTKRRSLNFSNSEQPTTDTNRAETKSPSPKLSNATLKRIEARKKLGESGSPSKANDSASRLSTSSNTSLPPRAEANTTAQGPPIVLGAGTSSATAAATPSTTGAANRPTSPIRVPSPSRANQLSPSRHSNRPSSSPLRSSNGGTSHSLSKRASMDFSRGLSYKRSDTNLSIQRAAAGTASAQAEDFMERSIAYLAIIKSRVPKENLSEADRKKLRSEVLSLVKLLGGAESDSDGLVEAADIDDVDLDVDSDEDDRVCADLRQLSINEKLNAVHNGTSPQEKLLEKYSDKLLELFQEKLAKSIQ